MELADDRMVHSSAVVVAPGLSYYVHRPAEYDHFSSELVSHTAGHSTFEHFAGKQVVVVGGGQSALETAALVQEQGAQVHVVTPLLHREDSFQTASACRSCSASHSEGSLIYELEPSRVQSRHCKRRIESGASF